MNILQFNQDIERSLRGEYTPARRWADRATIGTLIGIIIAALAVTGAIDQHTDEAERVAQVRP